MTQLLLPTPFLCYHYLLKCYIFPVLFQGDPRNIHLLYNFLKAAITPWSIGWSREVVLGGKKTILTSSSDWTSSKFGGCPGVLSSNRRAFQSRLFWLQNCNTLWHKCLAYHSEKICCVGQAFLFEVQMTGKRDFGIHFITLSVSEWYASNGFNFRVPVVFPPRSRVSWSLDDLKPGADFYSLKI